MKFLNDSKLDNNATRSHLMSQSSQSGRLNSSNNSVINSSSSRQNPQQNHIRSTEAGWNDLAIKNNRRQSSSNDTASTSMNSSHNMTVDNGSESETDTLVESDDEFRNPKSKTAYIDPSKCFSSMSLSNNQIDLRVKPNSLGMSSSHGSHNTSMSSITSSERPSLALAPQLLNPFKLSSSRVTASSSLEAFLSNPFYVLPLEADQNKPIRILVNEVIECGNFWCQINDDLHRSTIREIHNILNPSPTTKENFSSRSSNASSLLDSSFHTKYNPIRLIASEIQHDVLCVTSFKDKGQEELYRARILSVNHVKKEVEIIFVDFGNREMKTFDQLFKCSPELMEFPFQAVECKLVGIKPSIIKNPNGVWVREATRIFKELIGNFKI
jgi:hypothetical protein